jgi:hypothetical protein
MDGNPPANANGNANGNTHKNGIALHNHNCDASTYTNPHVFRWFEQFQIVLTIGFAIYILFTNTEFYSDFDEIVFSIVVHQ